MAQWKLQESMGAISSTKYFDGTGFASNFAKLQRVPALRAFWDLEKTMLHETRVSGTVLWSPTNANSPTYMYISPKPW